MKEFSCKTRITMGRGVIDTLGGWNFQRLLVVSDPFFAQNGMAKRVGQQAAAYEIFHKIQPDPSVALVAEGVALAKTFQPDALVLLGGGSAMDCGKAMAYFSGLDIPLIAIPTTSGSGSEVTDFAILTHNGVKHPLVDGKLRPDMAILEEELLTDLPPALVADGGFDVISHALEAFVAQNATAFTDGLAVEALRRCYALLPESFEGNKTVRLEVHMASTMAGLAFTQAGLGLCHGLSHALGGMFHVPHGRLNAILLPAVITCNADGAANRYAQLVRLAGFGGSSDTMAVRNLKNGLTRLRNLLKLPGTLAEAGVDPGNLRSATEDIVSAALKDPCCVTNPVPVTAERVRRVLREVAGRG